ncbi:MAG: radical SAM protein [Desulfobacter sp.]
MHDQPDIALIKLPNHNVDYPSLSIPTLTRALRRAGCSVVQDDLNVRLRDVLFTAPNLDYLTYHFLPEAGKYFLNDPEEYKRIKTVLNFLTQLDQNVGFSRLEKTKQMMLDRRYPEILGAASSAEDCSSVFILESVFHNIIDFSITCDTMGISLDRKNIVVDYLDRKMRELAQTAPRIIGFSVMDIQRKTFAWFARRLKKIFRGKIVAGGADVSIYNQSYLGYFDFIDAAFVREAEVSLVSFVRGAPLASIPGVIYRDGNDIVATPPEFHPENAVYDPDYSDFPLDKFLLPVLPVSASRGCAWAKCKFCVHHQTYSGYYERGALEVADNIEQLVNTHGVRHFHLTDDMLDVPLGTAIAREMISRGLDVNILTYARFDKRFTADILDTWRKGGICVIEWGLESASPRMLERMTKGISMKKVQEILDLSNRAGILNKLMLFHNYPGEEVEDFRESLDFVERNVTDRIIRPFFTVRNKLELRANSELDRLSRPEEQTLFPKRWAPSSLFQGKIEYADYDNYPEKLELLDDFLDRMQQLQKTRKVFGTNDENLTLDLIVWEMASKGMETKIHCK